MYRTRGKVLGVAVAVAASGVLAACGGNDSTASETPSAPTTASASPSTGSTTSSPETDEGDADATPQSEPPAEKEQEPPAPTERPAPVEPPEDVTDQSADLGEEEQAYIDALSEQGVKPSSPDIALSIGNYVCQGAEAGASDQSVATFVNAMAGSDPAFDPNEMPVEQAGRIYIDTAVQTYCK